MSNEASNRELAAIAKAAKAERLAKSLVLLLVARCFFPSVDNDAFRRQTNRRRCVGVGARVGSCEQRRVSVLSVHSLTDFPLDVSATRRCVTPTSLSIKVRFVCRHFCRSSRRQRNRVARQELTTARSTIQQLTDERAGTLNAFVRKFQTAKTNARTAFSIASTSDGSCFSRNAVRRLRSLFRPPESEQCYNLLAHAIQSLLRQQLLLVLSYVCIDYLRS